MIVLVHIAQSHSLPLYGLPGFLRYDSAFNDGPFSKRNVHPIDRCSESTVNRFDNPVFRQLASAKPDPVFARAQPFHRVITLRIRFSFNPSVFDANTFFATFFVSGNAMSVERNIARATPSDSEANSSDELYRRD